MRLRPVTGASHERRDPPTLIIFVSSPLYRNSISKPVSSLNNSETLSFSNKTTWSLSQTSRILNSYITILNRRLHGSGYRKNKIAANISCRILGALHWMLSDCKTIECTHRMPFSNISFSHFAVSFPGLVPHVLLMASSLILVARSVCGWVATYVGHKRPSLGHMGKPPHRECIHACAHIKIDALQNKVTRAAEFVIRD